LADSLGLLGIEHVGIAVDDLAALSAWYEETLGLELEHEFEIPEQHVRGRIIAGSGYRVELIESTRAGGKKPEHRKPGWARHGYTHICLRVKSIEEAFAYLVAAGAEPIIQPGPTPMPGYTFAYVADPEGNLVEVMQY
jgi:catechol 2,3-dioxygenase-like lactoylglutathione lyase family enzyme